MLLTRVITAVVLLAVLLPVWLFGSLFAIKMLCTIVVAAACWESCRLFWDRFVVPIAVVLTAIYVLLAFPLEWPEVMVFVWLFFSLIWVIHVMGFFSWLALFLPALKYGLPEREGAKNSLYGVFYILSIFSCFLSITYLLEMSDVQAVPPTFAKTFLLSVMGIVWVADIGAYFFGKAFGKHQLAPTISPGKTWEGVLGGWIMVLVVGAIATQIPLLSYGIFSLLKETWGWVGLVLGLSLLTMVSVTGDLIESQLKRRAQMKDSSHLLPGHGGVLDRIDALIFVMPIGVLIYFAMVMYYFVQGIGPGSHS